MTAGARAGNEAVVISLRMLPPTNLLRIIHLEQHTHQLRYSLRLPVSASQACSEEDMAQVLARLCEGQENGVTRFDTEAASYQRELVVLEVLLDMGLITESGDDLGDSVLRYKYFSLTEAGGIATAAGLVLRRGRPLAERRVDISMDDMTVWELVISLCRGGWTHRVCRPRDAPPPFVPENGGPKVWFTKPGSQSLSSNYLLLLAKQEKTIAHFQPAGYYKALLENKEWAPAAAAMFRHRALPEDTLDVEEALRPRRPREQPRRDGEQVGSPQSRDSPELMDNEEQPEPLEPVPEQQQETVPVAPLVEEVAAHEEMLSPAHALENGAAVASPASSDSEVGVQSDHPNHESSSHHSQDSSHSSSSDSSSSDSGESSSSSDSGSTVRPDARPAVVPVEQEPWGTQRACISEPPVQA